MVSHSSLKKKLLFYERTKKKKTAMSSETGNQLLNTYALKQLLCINSPFVRKKERIVTKERQVFKFSN